MQMDPNFGGFYYYYGTSKTMAGAILLLITVLMDLNNGGCTVAESNKMATFVPSTSTIESNSWRQIHEFNISSRHHKRTRWRIRTKRFHEPWFSSSSSSSSSIIDSKRYYNTNYEDYAHDDNGELNHYYPHIPIPERTMHLDHDHNYHGNDIGGHTNYNWPQNMKNITVTQGRNATFECVFPKLENFRLVWLHKDRGLVLAMHDSVISRNGRISVRSHANTTFYLTIHDVQESDRGSYMCQVNTVPMRKQIGHLEVNVPPSFVETGTSSDVNVNEHGSVSLQCEAKGRPKPKISWRREVPNSNQPVFVGEGNRLDLVNITRHQMGAYLCIASNGIPTTISQRIFVGINFAPVIRTPNDSLAVPISSTANLECHIESYPRPTIHWHKGQGNASDAKQIQPDRKYNINLDETNVPFKFISRLKINNIQKSDFDRYICTAQNNLGSGKGMIRITELERKFYKKPTIFETKKINIHHRTTTVRPHLQRIITNDNNQATGSQGNKESTEKNINRNDNYETTEEPETWDFDTNYLNPDIGTGKNNSPNRYSLIMELFILQTIFFFVIGVMII